MDDIAHRTIDCPVQVVIGGHETLTISPAKGHCGDARICEVRVESGHDYANSPTPVGTIRPFTVTVRGWLVNNNAKPEGATDD